MKLLRLAFLLLPLTTLIACAEPSFDKAFAECRYDMTKVRAGRPDMKFDKDPEWDKIFQRSLIVECMGTKGFNSIPTDKLELIK